MPRASVRAQLTRLAPAAVLGVGPSSASTAPSISCVHQGRSPRRARRRPARPCPARATLSWVSAVQPQASAMRRFSRASRATASTTGRLGVRDWRSAYCGLPSSVPVMSRMSSAIWKATPMRRPKASKRRAASWLLGGTVAAATPHQPNSDPVLPVADRLELLEGQPEVAARLHLGDGRAGHLRDGRQGASRSIRGSTSRQPSSAPDSSRSPDITATMLPQRAFTVGLPAAEHAVVDHVVVQQRRGVDQLGCDRRLDQLRVGHAQRVTEDLHQHRPRPLAAAEAQVPRCGHQRVVPRRALAAQLRQERRLHLDEKATERAGGSMCVHIVQAVLNCIANPKHAGKTTPFETIRPHRLDGVEARGPGGRVDAEHQAHARAHAQRQHHRPQRHRGRRAPASTGRGRPARSRGRCR